MTPSDATVATSAASPIRPKALRYWRGEAVRRRKCFVKNLLFSNRVVACYDDVKKGACKRKDCKFYHPPNHLKNVVHTNGRNNLRMR